jgi:hypothetical protein
MPFEARQLRVQLPCGSVTVMEADRHDAEIVAHRLTGWGDRVAAPAAQSGRDPSCGPGTSCGFHSGFNLGDLAHLCQGSDPLGARVVVEVTVLPILKEQLEARLKEIDAAQQQVARMTKDQGRT